MIQAIFNTTITVKRRASTGRDSLNNPVYGAPTSGAGWSTAYSNVPARLAFSSKQIAFAMTGERPAPNGTVYIPPTYTIQVEDRILTADNPLIEYTVVSIVPGYINNTVIDHWELIVALP